MNDCSQEGALVCDDRKPLGPNLSSKLLEYSYTTNLGDIDYPRNQRRTLLIGYLQRHLTSTAIAFEEKERDSRGRQELEIDVVTDTKGGFEMSSKR